MACHQRLALFHRKLVACERRMEKQQMYIFKPLISPLIIGVRLARMGGGGSSHIVLFPMEICSEGQCLDLDGTEICRRQWLMLINYTACPWSPALDRSGKVIPLVFTDLAQALPGLACAHPYPVHLSSQHRSHRILAYNPLKISLELRRGRDLKRDDYVVSSIFATE